MKYLLFVCALLFINTYNSQAQEASSWQTELEAAKEDALNSNQAILMVFSGSDWCKPCMQMKQRIWQSPEFSTFAQGNLVLLELDFPAKKKNKLSPTQTAHNEALAEKYQPKSFPTAILIDGEGQEIDRFGYQSTMDARDYIAYIKTKITQ